MAWPTTEADLAKVVADYLIATGWDVFQEVVWTRGRVDIVGVKGPLVWAIEAKKTFGLDLLAQGAELRPWVNLVSLAFPAPTNTTAMHSRSRRFAVSVAEREGMGLLQVNDPAGWRQPVEELSSPKINRKPLEDLRKQLEPEHRTYAAAGNADSRFWSPFKRTSARIRDYVAANPNPLGGCIRRTGQSRLWPFDRNDTVCNLVMGA